MQRSDPAAVGKQINTQALAQPFASDRKAPARAERRANMKAQPRAVRLKLKAVQAEMRRRDRETRRG